MKIELIHCSSHLEDAKLNFQNYTCSCSHFDSLPPVHNTMPTGTAVEQHVQSRSPAVLSMDNPRLVDSRSSSIDRSALSSSIERSALKISRLQSLLSKRMLTSAQPSDVLRKKARIDHRQFDSVFDFSE